VLAKWRSKNRDKVRQYNRDKRKRKKEGIVKRHRFHQYAIIFSELAKVAGTPSTVTAQLLDKVAAYWHSRCAYCGEITEEFDHILPVTKAHQGHNVIHNIVPACANCAEKKNETDIFFHATITGHKIGPILTWAAKDPDVIKKLNRLRESSYNHSFQSEMRVALKAAMSNLQK